MIDYPSLVIFYFSISRTFFRLIDLGQLDLDHFVRRYAI